MTPAGIEPATFRFVAQNLNHCATAVNTKTGWKQNTGNKNYILTENTGHSSFGLRKKSKHRSDEEITHRTCWVFKKLHTRRASKNELQ